MSEVTSTYPKKLPAYRYIRPTDALPTDIAYDAKAEDMIAKVKLFNPTGAATWWLCAYDPETENAFGVADLGYGPELGAIYLPELLTFRGRFGLPIERDIRYKPTTVAELIVAGRPYDA